MVGESKTPYVAATAGESLRRLRLRAGLGQGELAARAGISVRTLRNIENGTFSRPQAASIHRLAVALGLSGVELDGLLAGTTNTAPDETGPGLALRVDVLGPLTVRRGASTVEVTSAMQRSLIGLLAVQPRQPVGADEIVDLLWPDDPPRTCLQLVHTYIAQARRLLEPARGAGESASVLRRVAGGYQLDLLSEQSDLVQFTGLARQAGDAWEAGATESALQLHREALSHWRGPVLAGCDSRLREHPAAIRAAQQRIAAVQQWADAALSVARYDEVLGPLRVLHAEEPLHEGLAARLMLVLAGAGQQAAALALFESVKGQLDEQLGVSPGPELRTAQLRVLRGELPVASSGMPSEIAQSGASPAPVPAQLPVDVAGFAGRSECLRQLERFLRASGHAESDPGSQQPVTIAAVVGMGGVGKTALAVHWAHRVRDRFPDGQLFVNLRGHGVEGPLRPIDALSGFLLAFGTPADRIPQDEAQAAALYRSQTSGKRLLVVLDNAADADQVRPLLPTGAGSLAVVTARERMAGLVARDGAHLLSLDALEPEEAGTLLERMLGSRRVAAEPEAAVELARLCAHLPLALRIAAANLAGRPNRRIADQVFALSEGDRLGALAIDGDAATAVRANFALSCDALPAAERRLFRLTGLLPGADFTAPIAAALTGLPLARARLLLDRLANHHLLDEHRPGRFTMHDLLRLLAVELAGEEEDEATRSAALSRVSGHYRTHLNAAADLLYPHLLRLPDRAGAPETEQVRPFRDGAAALSWLDDECANLVALITHLEQQGNHADTWTLAALLNGYFVMGRSTRDWQAVAEAGRRAASAAGDVMAGAMTELNLGMVHNMRAPQAAAAAHHARAAELARQAGWIDGEAVALNNLARASWLAARLDETVDCLTRALALHRRSGRKVGEAVTIANLAVAHLERARHREHDRARESGSGATEAAELDARVEPLRLLHEALELHQAADDRRNEGDTVRILAEAHRDLGDYALALELSEQALAIADRAGDLRFAAAARNTRATVRTRLGDAQAAFDDHAEALRTAAELDDDRLRTQVLLDLAESHARLGQPDDALLRLHDVLALAHRSGSRLLERQARRVQDLVHEARPDLVPSVALPAPVSTAAPAPVRHRSGS